MPLNESRRLDLRNTVLWIAVGVGVTLRLLYAFLAQVEPWSDFESYVSMAHNIVRGVPIHTRLAPGYPVFLSGVYLLQGSIEAVWVANALLGGLGIVLVYGLTEKFWDDRKVAETAAWIAAVFPDFSVYAGVPASENLVIPLVLLVVLCLVAGQERGRLVWWVLAGLALGGAFLVRGMLLGILPLFVGWIWLDAYKGDLRRSVLPCLLLISSSVVVVAPWTVRNWRVHGAFVPVTTQMGLGLWGGNNSEADGEWMDDFLDRQPIPTELSEVERSRYQTRQALSFMVENPLDVAVLAIKKFGLFWGIKMDGHALSLATLSIVGTLRCVCDQSHSFSQASLGDFPNLPQVGDRCLSFTFRRLALDRLAEYGKDRNLRGIGDPSTMGWTGTSIRDDSEIQI